MGEVSGSDEPKAKQSRGLWTRERIASVPLILVLAGFFLHYLRPSVGAALSGMSCRKIALFLGLVGTALLLGRLKEANKRFYGVVAIFFGIGAVWDAVERFHLHGANVEWAQMSLLVVATLVVAEGFATWRTK